MIFTLEALQAKHGDSLLLHYGEPSAPRLIVIDGGPRGVYKKVLKPRLDAIKASRFPDEPLPIDLLMVSHIDDDHIAGILELTNDLTGQARHVARPYNIVTLWHNSFDDIVGNQSAGFSAALTAAATPAAMGPGAPTELSFVRPSAALAATVAQGRELRRHAQKLSANLPKGLIMAPKGAPRPIPMGNGLTLTVIGPTQDRLEELQDEWDKQLEKIKKAKATERAAMAAAFIDTSVYNLSSIVVLAEAGDRRMLLTGDALGDDILDGLKKLDLMQNDKFHVDLLKLPHHGSERNVSPDFFRQVTANHYVISANGKYGNPEINTLQMISKARGRKGYSVHFTNKEGRLEDFCRTAGRGRKYIFRSEDALSICVDLGKPLSG